MTIEKLNDVWTAAFNKGDAAAVAALYTEDAYVLPPGSAMVKGRPAIEAFWRQAAQQMSDATAGDEGRGDRQRGCNTIHEDLPWCFP